MNNNGLECNVAEVFEQFAQLTSKEMNKCVRKAINRGAQVLKKQTIENARAVMLTHDNKAWYDGKEVQFSDHVEDGVMVSKMEGGFEEELSQRVHIMGTRATGSQTYKLRFLEKGTKNRTAKTRKGTPLKKNRNLGSISPRWFFKKAQSEVFPNLQNIYIQEIEKTIQKINDTKL